ncbi:SDR family NAD(P)-dependent oxidoreductase [Telmatospirillum sp. J64-1]|uniref:SDR family NAD(P)-dependent oxidoreductase n=1 Tax=Telmatospirillum sp. J64-1 TaxID=2502183 RepID=UPI00163DC94A|nr:SDR family NAD(P)-dependent oxidoreductase [Telmatospirillum sp. J64-1]
MTTPFRELVDFTGRRVLVTGAASGIGEAITRTFAAEGATVIAADRNEAALEHLAGELGSACLSHVYDQKDIASVEKLAQAAGMVDVLVNNAGILLVEPLLELKWEDLRQVIDINLVGPMALTRLVGAGMIERRQGCVINIGSQLAFNGARDRSVYSSTKAAISQFTKTAALEWGEFGIRVNCIAPGKTITSLNRHILADPVEYEAGLKRTPLKRYGEGSDVANAALFLASEAAGYITGHTLVVDGGWILE